MSKIFKEIDTADLTIEFEAKKDRHLDRIYELRKACEQEMFDYIKKYVLDGRSIGEVFPVAHQGLVDQIEDQQCAYGHYVLEHIIEYEDIFIDKSYTLDRYKAMFDATPDSREGYLQ